MMTPVFEDLSEKYGSKCTFLKVDVDKAEVRDVSCNVLAFLATHHCTADNPLHRS